MGLDAPWHWVILALIVTTLFGYKKLPDMSRSVARSLRVFRTEIKGLTDDDPTPLGHPVYPPAVTDEQPGPSNVAQPEGPRPTAG